MRHCPNCGEENPERFRLCGFCGAQLAAPAAAEARKVVTIVFTDLVDSTPLAERLDSEALREVLSRYFEAMSAVLERHGGVVEKYIGDAVMAVFGLPRVHEDDALRAVRSALDMRDALAELNRELAARYRVSLVNRTGVNTGEVVAGDPLYGQRLVTGDAVNVANRLEHAAPPGGALLGELTYRLVRDLVEAEPAGDLELKGVSAPVRPHRLLGLRRADPGAPDESPFVGRAAELRVLRDAFDDARRRRRGRLVTLAGDPGVGKSRLIREFLAAAAGEATVLRGRCLSYGEGITFWPLAEVVRAAAGPPADAPAAELFARVAALVGEEGDEVAARLAAATGASELTFGLEETFWAARRFFESLAAAAPLVVVFDDVHWAEETFLELVEQAVAALRAPVLVLCAARADLLAERPAFGVAARGVRIDVEPLSPDEAGRVVDELAAAGLPDPVRRLIVDAADGNPFFAEQLLAMLVEEGVTGPSSLPPGALRLPPTIHAVLAARLDGVTGEERAVVEPASVMGQVFYAAPVAELLGAATPGDVDLQLAALVGRRLVRPTADAFREDAYRFHHTLIRDAAYRGILKRARARFHEAFADWLVRHAGDRLMEFEEILGYHLEQACRYLGELGSAEGERLAPRAARHLTAGGRRAFARGDAPAAANLLGRAAELLAPDAPERAALASDLGEALAGLGEFERAEAVLAGALELARKSGDDVLAANASVVRLLVRNSTDREQSAASVRAQAESAIATLEAAGDHAGVARAWRLIAFAYASGLRYGEAEKANERMLAHAVIAGDERLRMRSIGAFALAAAYGPTPVHEAVERCERLRRETAADRRTQAVVLAALATLRAMEGRFDDARALYRDERAVLTELGGRMLGSATALDSGPIELLAGDPAAAERELRRDYEALAEMGESYFLSNIAALLGQALVEQGRADEAVAFADTSERLAADDDLEAQALFRTVRARALAVQGEHELARRLAIAAVELLEPTQALVSQADTLAGLAEVLELGGDEPRATSVRRRALALYERKGNVVAAARMRSAIAAVPAR